ncbi:MAG: hypothetical protein R3F46_12105 [bacterium]
MALPSWIYTLRNLPAHFVVYLMIFVARVMPQRAAIAFGGNLGVLLWYIFPRWRKTSMRNVELFFGEQKSRSEAWRIGRDAAWNIGCHVMEFIMFGCKSKETVLAMIEEVEGLEAFREAADRGQGVIAIGMHYGNWEVVAAWITCNVRTMHAVGKKQSDPFFTNIAFPWRAKFGVQNIYAGKQANSAILKALRDGDILGLVADVNGGTTGVFVPFCGIPASTVPGPGVLAVRSGAPMFLVFSRRIAPGRHKLHIRQVDLSGIAEDRAQAQLDVLQRVNDAYELAISQDPTQWLWGHKRWKTRPEGEPWLY